jgi:hypothetical protein
VKKRSSQTDSGQGEDPEEGRERGLTKTLLADLREEWRSYKRRQVAREGFWSAERWRIRWVLLVGEDWVLKDS